MAARRQQLDAVASWRVPAYVETRDYTGNERDARLYPEIRVQGSRRNWDRSGNNWDNRGHASSSRENSGREWGEYRRWNNNTPWSNNRRGWRQND